MVDWLKIIFIRELFEGNRCSVGKGLGKDETGISKPIKCGLKFDKMGVGYQEKLTEETTNRWWEKAYNEAASNITSTGASKEGSCFDTSAFSKLTDEELFKACGGRTAHKAARHGLRLGGKLERIEHQEKKSIDEKKKRKKGVRSESCEDEKNDVCPLEYQEDKSLDKRKRKKETRRKSDCDKSNLTCNERGTVSKNSKSTKKSKIDSKSSECLSD